MKKRILLIALIACFIVPSIFLVAGCKEDTYKLNFYNEGSQYHSLEIKKGQKIEMPQEPTKDGFSFGGWYFDEGVWEDEYDGKSIKKNTTLYAKWIEVFNVYFMGNYGEEVYTQDNVLIQTQEVLDGNLAQIPGDAYKAGHDFLGWTVEGEDFDFSTPITEDTIIMPKFKIHTFTVRFFDDVGNQLGEDYIVPYGHSVTPPQIPEKTGYRGWWSVNETGLSSVKSSFDVTIRYEAIGYIIYLDPNGGEEDYIEMFVTLVYNEPVGELWVPYYEGYEFNGWYCNGVLVTEDMIWDIVDPYSMTFIAHWIEIEDEEE